MAFEWLLNGFYKKIKSHSKATQKPLKSHSKATTRIQKPLKSHSKATQKPLHEFKSHQKPFKSHSKATTKNTKATRRIQKPLKSHSKATQKPLTKLQKPPPKTQKPLKSHLGGWEWLLNGSAWLRARLEWSGLAACTIGMVRLGCVKNLNDPAELGTIVRLDLRGLRRR